jgi:anti-sigma-K factor RskA
MQLRAASAALAGNVPGLRPDDAIRSRLLAEIDALPSAAPAGARRLPEASRRAARPATQWLPWALAAGMAAVCVVFVQQSAQLRAQYTAQLQRADQLNAMADRLRAEDTTLRQAVTTLRENNRLAGVRIAVLSSLLASVPKAVAVSLWDNQRQSGVFVVHRLRPLPPDRDYQLWIIDPKYPAPVSAGVFQVDAQGNVRVEFRAKMPIESANAFAVTQEVKGGADMPTLKAMVLMGS